MVQFLKSLSSVGFLSVAMIMIATSSVFPIIGIGAHYGIDLTMKMDNKAMEQTDFSNLKFSLSGLPAFPDTFKASTILTGNKIPVFINRRDWKNTGINFGGKIYVDILPFIDIVELSTNFGVWQYNGEIVYPTGLKNPLPTNGSKFGDYVTYDTLAVTLKNLYPNRFFWGVNQTPYAKFHFDATIKKYVFKIPPVLKTVKGYAGLGMTLDFATPMLSSKLIEDAIGSTLSSTMTLSQMGSGLFNNQEVMKKVIDKILDDLMTPHYGCHLAVGTMVKLPMIPLGFYLDAKYIIRFDKLDKYVDIGGNGFLFNIGAALAF